MSEPTRDELDQMASRLGRAGLWHASQGSALGDSVDGGQVASMLRAGVRAMDATRGAAPAAPKSERCETCRFWEALDPGLQEQAPNTEGPKIGDCRRSPPQFSEELFRRQAIAPTYRLQLEQCQIEADIYEASRFPLSREDDWCGEFEWRRNLQPQPITGC